MDPSTQIQTCYKHPDRPAGIVCQRCDRPICPSCMHQASVGFHCPECTKAGAQKVYQGIGALQVQPVLTQILIAINVAIFVIGAIANGTDALGGGVGTLETDFGLTAKLWDLNGALYLGPFPGSELIGVGGGEWYRMLTSGFLHFGLIHIAFNMYALWILGRAVEQMGGRLRLGLIYFVSMLAGSVGALVLSPQSLTAGASGAIFGLMGAIFLAHRARGIPFQNSPLLGILILNLFISVGVSSISLGGHVGGLIGGAIAGWVLFDLADRPGFGDRRAFAVCGVLMVGLMAAGITVATSFQPF